MFIPAVALILLSLDSSNCRDRSISAGYGNFEAFNIGMRHQGKRYIYNYGYGNDLNIFGQGFYNCIFAGVGRPILKKRIYSPHLMSLHGRILVWNIENKSNVFSAVSFSPSLQYTRNINGHFSLTAHAGYVYSSVFRYKRKGFYEIGWPKEWLPDFGFSIQYKLSCR